MSCTGYYETICTLCYTVVRYDINTYMDRIKDINTVPYKCEKCQNNNIEEFITYYIPSQEVDNYR